MTDQSYLHYYPQNLDLLTVLYPKTLNTHKVGHRDAHKNAMHAPHIPGGSPYQDLSPYIDLSTGPATQAHIQ
jgi:hypothetical protein